MQSTLYKTVIYALLACCFVGCRGCSCNPPSEHVLETIVHEIKLDSANIARVRIEHVEKKGRGFTFKFKSHGSKTYATVVRYDLQFNDRPWRNIVYEHDDSKTDSMVQHIDDISIKISSDKLHLLLEFQNTPISLFHLLVEGMPFTTTIEPDEVKKLAAEFAKDALPSPEKIMEDYVSTATELENNLISIYIKKTLNQQQIPSPLDKPLLEHIGMPLVDDFYAFENRAGQLAYKNKKDWRTRATKLVYRYVGEASRAKNPMEEAVLRKANGSVNLFVSGLNNYMDNRGVERQVLPLYPFYAYTVHLYNKVEDRTLRKNEVIAIEKNCKKLLTDDAFRAELPDEKLAAEEAIEFLIRYRDDRKIENFEAMIACIFRKPIVELGVKNLDAEILFPYGSRFSEEEQKIIVDYARKVDAEFSEKKKNFHLKNFLEKIDRKANPKKEKMKPQES